MSCYLRHLQDLFESLGIEYDKLHRKLVDGAIRSVLEMNDEQSCPEVWSAIKALPPERRAELAALVAGKMP